MVLLAVLVVVVLLSLAAYQYSELMTAESRASASYARAAQARALADSGIHYALAVLAESNASADGAAANPFNNPSSLQGVPVQEDINPKFVGRFSLIAPSDPDALGGQAAVRFGVGDEAGKINLNALLQLDSSGKVAHDMLVRLPNMTEEIADAMIDWIDTDEQPRSSGAESSHYSGLNPSYACKNGPLDTLEELLLVRGVTQQLLLGNDRNRNGQRDRDESDDVSGISFGWAPYLTVFSREPNVSAEGVARVYVNDADLMGLYSKLQTAVGEDLAVYILAYRIYGPASGSSRNTTRGVRLTTAELGNLASATTRPRSLSSLYELIDTSVQIPSTMRGGSPTRYACPLNDPATRRQLLPLLLDAVSTRRDTVLPGRINVNTAPQAVLAALPGLSEADVQNILQRRPQATDPWAAVDPLYRTSAWLLTEANLQPSQMRTLEQYITARSRVYRVQSVGYFDGGGPSTRVEAVIDASGTRPRIVYYRDLSELGKGVALTARERMPPQ